MGSQRGFLWEPWSCARCSCRRPLFSEELLKLVEGAATLGRWEGEWAAASLTAARKTLEDGSG
jgi:hypothetical protein